MKKLLCTIVALGAMTSVAVADPVKLTDAQMTGVAAGAPVVVVVNPVNNLNVGVVTQVAPSVAVAVGVLGGRAAATAVSVNVGGIHQTVGVR